MRRIRVVGERCQGHARCAALVPELFDLDADGYSVVLPGRELIPDGDEETVDRALLAVESCPEQAIRVDLDG
jgi:ferredoxin